MSYSVKQKGSTSVPLSWCCPKCGSEPQNHVIKNVCPIDRMGDVFCKCCGTRVRDYDPT